MGLVRSEPCESAPISPVRPVRAAYNTLRTYKSYLLKNAMLMNEADSVFVDYISCVAVSPHLGKNCKPLWGYVAGPPSSGKTKVMQSFDGWDDYVLTASEFTQKAMSSASDPTGARAKIRQQATNEGSDPNEADRELDPSMLPRLNGKMLLCPDLTATLSDENMRNAIFGTLRIAYDGHYVRRSGTLGAQDVTVCFSFLGALTDDTLDMAQAGTQQAGERMVALRLQQQPTTWQEDLDIARFVTAKRLNQTRDIDGDVAQVCRDALLDGINQVRAGPVKPTDKQLEYLTLLAGCLVKVRTQPGRYGAVSHERIPRMLETLQGFADCRARLCGRARWSAEDLRFCQRIAYDTLPRRSRVLLDFIYARSHTHKNEPSPVRMICEVTGLRPTMAQQQLIQWADCGLVSVHRGNRFALDLAARTMLIQSGMVIPYRQ